MTTRNAINCALALFVVLLATADLGPLGVRPAAGAAGTGDPLADGAGARERVLGGGAAAADPAAALGWNPARLAAASGLLIHAHLAPLPEGGSLDAFGVTWPFGPGVLGGSLTRLGVGDVATFDAQGIPSGSADFGDAELAVGYGLGLPWPFGGAADARTRNAPLDSAATRGFSPAMDLGAALRIRRQSFASQSGLGLGLDLGLTFEPRPDVALGLRARNLLAPALTVASEVERLPRSLSIAGTWTRGMMGRSMLLAGEAQVGGGEAPFALGVEMPVAAGVLGRAGIRGKDYRLGLGFAARFFAFDYGLEAHELGFVHVVSVTARLGPGAEELKAKAEAAAAAEKAAVAAAAAEEAVETTVEDLREQARAASDREAARAAWLGLRAHHPDDPEAAAALKIITIRETQEMASWRDSLQVRERERRAAVDQLRAVADSLALARRDLHAQRAALAAQQADLSRLQALLRAVDALAAGERERALGIADSLLARDPRDPEVLALRAWIEPRGAQIDPARRDEARSLYVEGMRRFNAGDYAEAIRYWEQLLALDPGNQAVRMNIEEARTRQGADR